MIRAAVLLLLPLAACAPGASPQVAASAPATTEAAVYACQMRGAQAEDRVYGPLGDLSVDSALVRAQVTQDCLAGRPGPIIVGRPGLR
jgi:hypothetical protein